MSVWKRRDPVDEPNERLEQRVKELERKVHILEDTVKTLKNTQPVKQMTEDGPVKSQPLEAKVKALEETLETLKSMQMSDQMAEFIRKKERTLKMTSLINSVSEKPAFDFRKEEASITHLKDAKKSIDDQIKQALRNAGSFSDDYPNDPRYFNYEVENGLTTLRYGSGLLTKFIGKGLRITSYNGFETGRVIVPNEIDGQPVISIGEKVFKNATLSEVILPKSIKVILSEAFSGCKKLKNIDLPDTLEYLDERCFENSGLSEIRFPHSLISIPSFCCYRCDDLEQVAFGNQIKTINGFAFRECRKLRSVSLPESLGEIKLSAFARTSINSIIIPEKVIKVSRSAFEGISGKVVCVFLGKDTVVDIGSLMSESFSNVALIHCLPGSKIQQIAREHSIPIKPLSEFRMG